MGTGSAAPFDTEITDVGSVIVRSSGDEPASRITPYSPMRVGEAILKRILSICMGDPQFGFDLSGGNCTCGWPRDRINSECRRFDSQKDYFGQVRLSSK